MLAIVAACLAIPALTGAEVSPAPDVSLSRTVARSGSSLTITVSTSATSESCRLQSRSPRGYISLVSTARAGSSLRWSGRVSSRAVGGRWRLIVTCGDAPSVSRSLVLRGSGSSSRLFSAVPRVTRGDSSTASSAPTRPTQVPDDQVGLMPTSLQNPFPKGQCTWWAYEKRPDVYAAAMEHGSRVYDWSGGNWSANARDLGYSVDQQPRAGDLATHPPDEPGGPGHVAYVEAVTVDPTTGSTQVSLSDMNVNGNPEVTYRTIGPSDPHVYTFIHQR